MEKVLLTGGRAPVALDLARSLHRAGHAVYMAESLPGHLSQPSRAITANFKVPPPRQQTAAYIRALRAIILREGIGLLLPTCEEVFYVAMRRESLPCDVFVDGIEMLRGMHSKWLFVQQANAMGLRVPRTTLVDSRAALERAFSELGALVLKPVFSRFASRILITPTFQSACRAINLSPAEPWIAQEYVDGRQLCTYSISHGGRLTAHTTYEASLKAGSGAAVFFRHEEHPKALEWVSQYLSATRFNGQVGFDLVENAQGEILGLECNPRATSGLHLLAGEARFTEAFTRKSMPCLTGADSRPAMLATGMLLYSLPTEIASRRFSRWAQAFATSRDVVLNGSDPLPFLLQWRAIAYLVDLARREGVSVLAASTLDIEWNGEIPEGLRATR